MQNDKKNPNEQQINIELSEEIAEGIYSNLAIIGVSIEPRPHDKTGDADQHPLETAWPSSSTSRTFTLASAPSMN
jgi:hypothetical protein